MEIKRGVKMALLQMIRLLTFIIMVMPSAVMAATSLQLAIMAGERGSVVEVPVTLQTDSAVTELQFDVTYNPGDYIISGTANSTSVVQSTHHVISSAEISPGTRRVEERRGQVLPFAW